MASIYLDEGTARFVDRASKSESPVLLLGETGTGKSALARVIHDASGRRASPFVRFDVAACQPELLASHLFGCERGAFTDARDERRGIAEEAHRGTLFLDEVDGLSVREQRMLLTLCQEGLIRRLGASRERAVDVRVVAASNGDLRSLMAQGRFRGDLYHRLNVLTWTLPPLRDRREELPQICRTVCRSIRERRNLALSSDQMDALTQLLKVEARHYPWPGNIRELENVVERLLAFGENGGGPIRLVDLLDLENEPEGRASDCRDANYRERRRYKCEDVEAERAQIEAAVDACAAAAAAAAALGMSRQTLWRKMRRHGLGWRVRDRDLCD